MLVFIFIIVYGLILVLAYLLILKRLKTISKQHFSDTGIMALANGYKVVSRKLILMFIILFILGSLVLLTFMENELLYQGGFYNNKETLDNNGF